MPTLHAGLYGGGEYAHREWPLSDARYWVGFQDAFAGIDATRMSQPVYLMGYGAGKLLAVIDADALHQAQHISAKVGFPYEVADKCRNCETGVCRNTREGV